MKNSYLNLQISLLTHMFHHYCPVKVDKKFFEIIEI